MPNDRDRTFEVLIEEFKTLKAEQHRRITARDNSIYLTIIAIGAALALLEKLPHPALLLVVAWVCLLLGWHHLMNDLKVSQIGEYITDQLDPRIRRFAASLPMAFKWEDFHAADAMRVPRKIFQTHIDLLVFVLPGLGAIVGYWVLTNSYSHLYTGKPLTGGTEVRIFDFFSFVFGVSIIAYASQIIYYSQYRKHIPKQQGE